MRRRPAPSGLGLLAWVFQVQGAGPALREVNKQVFCKREPPAETEDLRGGEEGRLSESFLALFYGSGSIRGKLEGLEEPFLRSESNTRVCIVP